MIPETLRLDLDRLNLDPEEERELLDRLVALERQVAAGLVARGVEVAESYAEVDEDGDGRHDWLDRLEAGLDEHPDAADLHVAWADAHRLRWKLAMSGLDQVLVLLRKHTGRKTSLADLRQEGVLGLYEAARRFEPGRGLRFSTYCRWWARAYMAELLGRQEWAVRLPRAARQQLGRLNRSPDEPGYVNEQQTQALRRVRYAVSLDAPVGKGDDAGRTRGELTADPAGVDPEQAALQLQRRRMLARARKDARLNERHHRILSERFELDGQPTRTLAAIGRDLGISGERVRQIQAQAIRRLRKELSA